MNTQFRKFATSTSNGRTAQVTRMCLICGARTISTAEVNGFNEWSFKKEYPGKHGYTGFETFRHIGCIVSGKRDYTFLAPRDPLERDLAHEADIREVIKEQLASEECDDLDLEFDDIDIDEL